MKIGSRSLVLLATVLLMAAGPSACSSGGGTAGSGGAGGAATGTGGAGAGTGGSGGSAGGAGGGATLDACFRGLRALEGRSQIATKENRGEGVRLRVALETADRLGTSGTAPWEAIRVALDLDGEVICLDEPALADAYTTSHHNCADVLQFERAGRRYEIQTPDTSSVRPTTAVLTIYQGATVVRGPVSLTLASCTPGQGSVCSSGGGPC